MASTDFKEIVDMQEVICKEIKRTWLLQYFTFDEQKLYYKMHTLRLDH